MTFVRLISDLHYEFYNRIDKVINHVSSIIPRGDEKILILAGDICTARSHDCGERLSSVLKIFKSNWKHVLFIPGNHEYFDCVKANLDIDTADRIMRKICDQIGVIFLQRDTIVIDNICFAGCTLWSNASKEDLFYTNDVGRAFKTPEEFLSCHRRDLEFLKQQSADVFVTHYLPSYRCIHERFLTFMGNACFATDLEDLMKPPLRYWFHGHTHEAVDETINKVRIIANPHGYPGERKLTSFTDKSIKIGAGQ